MEAGQKLCEACGLIANPKPEANETPQKHHKRLAENVKCEEFQRGDIARPHDAGHRRLRHGIRRGEGVTNVLLMFNRVWYNTLDLF